MAITLITTPKAANANSYAEVVDADSYNETHLYNTAWTGATSERKKAALVWATRLLDNEMEFMGWKTTSTQKLLWPRVGVWDREGQTYFDDDLIPYFIVDAVSELARKLLEADRTAEPDTKGFTQIRVGSISLTIDKNDAQFAPLPDSVLSMLQDYGGLVSSNTIVDIRRV